MRGHFEGRQLDDAGDGIALSYGPSSVPKRLPWLSEAVPGACCPIAARGLPLEMQVASAANRARGPKSRTVPEFVSSIVDVRLSPATAATPIKDRRALFERLHTWRERSRPRLAWCAIEFAVFARPYDGAARLGLRPCYVHGSATALWSPVGVGIGALDAEFAVSGCSGRAHGFILRGPAA